MASIQVYPYLSPRLIEVLAPDTEITIQELVNLCRDWEDDEENMSYEFLISAAGKEALGGGITVGITATLNNAQVFFSPRSTPRDDGTGRTCDATDTLGRQLYVDDADFITDGVQRGDIVYNETTGSSAAILEIVDQFTLNHLQLSGGTSTQWTSGDNYIVFENVQCNISGGNLVAVDDIGADLTSVFNAFGTQIIRTSSSSATLQELEAIQFASYTGQEGPGVWLDVTNQTGLAQSGTNHPVGTRQAPCISQQDAYDIAVARGLNRVYVISNITLSSSITWDGFAFVGESAIKSNIVVPSAVSAVECEYYECYLSGTLDGSSQLERSVLGTLTYVEGYVFNCALDPMATITLGTGTVANILQCFSGQPGIGTPTINCGGNGSLGLRDYVGGIRIENCTAAVSHSLDLSSGQVILDSTSVTNGTFVVRGIGKLIDENGTPIVSDVDGNNRPIPTIWNGGVTILNELLTAGDISGTGGGGSSPWSTAQRDEVIQYARKASDNAEQANLKL